MATPINRNGIAVTTVFITTQLLTYLIEQLVPAVVLVVNSILDQCKLLILSSTWKDNEKFKEILSLDCSRSTFFDKFNCKEFARMTTSTIELSEKTWCSTGWDSNSDTTCLKWFPFLASIWNSSCLCRYGLLQNVINSLSLLHLNCTYNPAEVGKYYRSVVYIANVSVVPTGRKVFKYHKPLYFCVLIQLREETTSQIQKKVFFLSLGKYEVQWYST